MSNTRKAYSIAGGIVAEEMTKRFTERTYRIFSDADRLSDLANKWKNVAPDKAQGHMFEQLETIKFNMDALKKDSNLYAKTTASMGLPTDPVDIIITNGKKTLREVQAKSCNSAARSAFALSQDKYEEMLRLGPSDQHAKIEELLKERIKTGTLKAEDYEQTLRNLKESLRHENVASKGTTYQEALDATNQDTANKIASEYKIKSALVDMNESGKRAGKIGAVISGGTSVITEGYAYYKGDREFGETVVNVAVSGAKGYATGYTVTALSKGITHTTSYLLGTSIAKAASRANAPMAIAAGIVNTGKSMVKYLNGDIDSEKLLDEISHTAITGSASFYYAALGQAVIPIPVVGALVGAGVGYFIGNVIHQSGLVALGDSKIVKEAKERRKHIEAICLATIPEIRKNRLELELQAQEYFGKRKNQFILGFTEMDRALQTWNPEDFIQGLGRIGNSFDVVLPFKSFKDFDEFMKSSDKAFDF